MKKRVRFPLRVAAFSMAAMMSVPMVDYTDIFRTVRVQAETTKDSETSVKNMNDYVVQFDEEAYIIKGEGTIDDPYIISNEAQFLTFTNEMKNGNTYAGKYIVQTCDLDMTLLANYKGLAMDCYWFSGDYNGMGHTINIDFNYIAYYGSIFSKVNGTIKNLGVTGRVANEANASFTGKLLSGGKILNVWSTVDSLNSSYSFAAIAFNTEAGATISNCYYKGSVKSRTNYGIANGRGTVSNSKYCMETGSSSVYKNTASGEASTDFSVSALNKNLADGLTEYEKIDGEDFAFKGNTGRLSSISYTYTTKFGQKKNGVVEGVNAYSREYTVNLTDADTSKEITVNGKAIDLAGSEKVTGSTVIIGNENDVRATVSVDTAYEYDGFSTNNTTKYYINFTTNEDIDLKNSDFEAGINSWTNGNGSIVSNGIDGGKCLRITNDSIACSEVTQKIQLEPDTNYVLTGYVKSEGTFESDGASIDVEENYGYLYDQENNWLRGTNDWKFVRVYFTTSYTGEVEVRCRVGHGWDGSVGTGYFDNLCIEKLEYPGDETVSRVLYEEDNTIEAITKGIVNVIGMDNYKEYSDMMDECYLAEADLIGSTPFNGAKAIIINDNQPVINNYGGIGNGNPARLCFDQLSYFENNANGKGGCFSWTHELGHVFEKCHDNNSEVYSYDFHAEFWTNTKMLYLLDTVDSFKVEMGSRHWTFSTADEMGYYYKVDSSGGYDKMIAGGKFTEKTYDALTYVFIQIKDVVGWEPIKATFRNFINNEANTKNKNNGNLFEEFIRLIQENYNPGGTEVMDTIGEDVYEMILAGMDYMPAYGIGDKSVEYATIDKNNTEFSANVDNGELAGEHGKSNTISGIKISLEGTDSIFYRGYIDGQWTEWVTDNGLLLAGKRGTIQAIQIKLSDELAKKYNVVYRTTNRYYGYLGWTANGKTAGDMSSEGAIEGLEVMVLNNNKSLDGYIDKLSTPACKNKTEVDEYIYFKNTSNWSEPYIYMWNSDSDKLASWPGVKMELVDAKEKIYRYPYTGKYAKCIFSNKGQSQTANLNCSKGNCIFTKSDNLWTDYVAISDAAIVNAVYMDEDGTVFSNSSISGKIGASFECDEKSFSGYTLKEIVGNTTGKMSTNFDEIKFIYKKSITYTNKWVKEDGKWYYYDAEGNASTGWKKISSKWYYFNADGIMQTGWVKLSGKWYYLDKSGAMKTGWVNLSGKWYYLDKSGVMQASKWIGNYYVKANGVMATSEWVDGGKYYVDANGLWVRNQKKA